MSKFAHLKNNSMKLFLFTILLFAAHLSIAQKMIRGKVIRVADGDTFTLLDATNTQIKVRLYGIDSPEKGQDFYQVAKTFTSDQLFQKEIAIEILYTDRYRRSVAQVWINDSLTLNVALLKAGLAWHYTAFDKSPNFAQAEQQARKQKLHIWSHKNSIAPWDFRKAKRTKSSIARASKTTSKTTSKTK